LNAGKKPPAMFLRDDGINTRATSQTSRYVMFGGREEMRSTDRRPSFDLDEKGERFCHCSVVTKAKALEKKGPFPEDEEVN